ncbi:MAG: Xaa-Pro peptidase family protein [Actinomycetota bacterium]|nr:Xaa-Pro peptidase family protein [Actinomycetota bacterium]
MGIGITARALFSKRLALLRAAISRGQIGCLFISNPANVRYLTGFDGSLGFVAATRERVFFLTDSRYGPDALKPGAGNLYETVVMTDKLETALKRLFKKAGIKKAGFEPSCSYGLFEKLKSTGAIITPVRDIVERLREQKDLLELDLIKKAVVRAEEAFFRIKKHIRPGVPELAIAAKLEIAIRDTGALKPAFPAIVAAGPNSAIPHARPSGRKIAKGDLLILDWGAECGGYYSDMTRTFICGTAGAEAKKIYNIVLKAQKTAFEFIVRQPRASSKNIDKSARYVIKHAGYGDFFGHSLGHGVGLDVHEMPVLSGRAPAKMLPEGAVFTLEPGIYLPERGGVRIEDMVFLREGRQPEILTHLPKDIKANTLGGF